MNGKSHNELVLEDLQHLGAVSETLTGMVGQIESLKELLAVNRASLAVLRPGDKDYHQKSTQLGAELQALEVQLQHGNDQLNDELVAASKQAVKHFSTKTGPGTKATDAIRKTDTEILEALFAAHRGLQKRDALCNDQRVLLDRLSRINVESGDRFAISASPTLPWQGLKWRGPQHGYTDYIDRFVKCVFGGTPPPQPGEDLVTWFKDARL